jgi:uncharacterized protein YjbI with pentapeptide repeats
MRKGVEMKSTIPLAIMLLFVFSALSLGWAFAGETTQADEKITTAINETATNESLGNDTQTNETLINATLTNKSLENATLTNESLENATLVNETLNNLTMPLNDTNPFAKIKGRQPSRR